jgi:hypothetical protein
MKYPQDILVRTTNIIEQQESNQTWKALSKAWLGYTIAKNKEEGDRMKYYASVIQKLRKELGLPPASFPDLFTDEDITKVQQQKEFRK